MKGAGPKTRVVSFLLASAAALALHTACSSEEGHVPSCGEGSATPFYACNKCAPGDDSGMCVGFDGGSGD